MSAAPAATGGMIRKKVDERVRTLIENGVHARHRSFFVIVGDRGKDQVANLHYILSKSQVRARPSVLWCYSKELGFSTCVAAARATPSYLVAVFVFTHARLPPQPPPKAHEGDQKAAGKGPVRPRARRPL